MVRVDVAPDVSRVLGGRALAVLIEPASAYKNGRADYQDIWVLAHGRLVRHRVRLDWAAGSWSDMFSLSRDGRQIAYLVQPPVVGEGGPRSRLFVSQPDGTAARGIGGSICPLCYVSTPSWGSNGRYFVVSVEAPRARILRLGLAGSTSWLTPPGARHDEWEPVISPDGKEIAFLRGLGRAGHALVGDAKKLVYVMRPDGRARVRLPLAARDYRDLWWCGSGGELCTDVYTGNDPCNPHAIVCAAAASRGTFQIGVRSGRVSERRHWRRGPYTLQSHDAHFAIATRKAGHGWRVVGGPIDTRGRTKLHVLLVAPRSKANPFQVFSLSGT